MRILVTTRSDTYALEVSEDLELENFKVLCGAESGMETSEIVVAFNGRKLTEDKKSLKDYGIKDGDMIMAMPDASVLQSAVDMMQQASAPRNPPAPSDIIQFDFGSIQVPGLGTPPSSAPATTARSSVMPSVPGQAGNPETSNANSTVSPGQDPEAERSPAVQDDLGLGESAGNQDDPAVIRDMLLANPEQLALLKHNNPKLAEALTSGDLDRFAVVLRDQQDARKDRERQRIRLLSSDPFDMEAQRMIADEIQQENINANMEAAMEFNPESFGTVHMLYINCLVNGHPVKAFIDSGAQTTIMSQSCAERCNIMRLVDNRWAGIAKGVGTQRIIGRVHMGQIQIGGDFLASSFSILEDQPMDMLLGLDMLKRHQMCIDLKENHLLIGTTSSRTPFLHESELPACARLTAHSEEDALKQSERAARQHEEQALAKALADSAMEHSGPSNAPAPPTPTAPTPTAATPTAARTPTAPTFPERDVEELMAIGFSRAEVLLELQRQRGNKTQAMAALFAKSFKMGP